MNKALSWIAQRFFTAGPPPQSARTQPGFPYNGVLKDISGEIIAKQKITVRFTIRDASTNGKILYQEICICTTTRLGAFAHNIGQGNAISGNYDSISWHDSKKFLQVELDREGGENYTNMGAVHLKWTGKR